MDPIRRDDLAAVPELFDGMDEFFAVETAGMLRKALRLSVMLGGAGMMCTLLLKQFP